MHQMTTIDNDMSVFVTILSWEPELRELEYQVISLSQVYMILKYEKRNSVEWQKSVQDEPRELNKDNKSLKAWMLTSFARNFDIRVLRFSALTEL